MNSLDGSYPPHRYVKFGEEAGLGFYFDTARMDERGECPVVIRADWRVLEVASDFVDLLCSFDAELDEWLADSPSFAEALAAHSSET